MLPLLGEKPESRIHRWCAGCLRDYKEQRSRPEAMAFGSAQSAMSPAALDALERYSFSEEHDEQQQEQQEMSSRTADEEAAEDVLKDCRRCGLFKPLKASTDVHMGRSTLLHNVSRDASSRPGSASTMAMSLARNRRQWTKGRG